MSSPSRTTTAGISRRAFQRRVLVGGFAAAGAYAGLAVVAFVVLGDVRVAVLSVYGAVTIAGPLLIAGRLLGLPNEAGPGGKGSSDDAPGSSGSGGGGGGGQSPSGEPPSPSWSEFEREFWAYVDAGHVSRRS